MGLRPLSNGKMKMELKHITGFESLESEFEHTCAITNGLAELAKESVGDNELSGDAVYADTVLKLHGIDLVEVEGQESFLDNVKKGGQKVYEWIKNLLRAIRDWINGDTARQFTKAKKSLEGDVVNRQVKQLATKGIDGLATDGSNHEIIRIIRRLSSSDKMIINQKIKEVALTDEAEARHEEIQSETIERISGTVKRQLAGVAGHIKEIKRIDPNGETLTSLNTSIEAIEKAAKVDRLEADFTGTKVSNLTMATRDLIDAAGDMQSILASATVALDKLNEANKDTVDEGKRRSLSRAVAVDKELGAIAARYRDAVITLDSQLQIGEKKTSKAIVKDAIKLAKEEVSEEAGKYLAQLADEFMN
ncbi:putative virion structural protein [Klebsiella phage N1M2]|uniref:Putative virion structural protein n=1 Tax=Klebsiella phage N1M2 TaxID=2664939 RepID=A0A6B7ZF01_9CAUD|nr:putative virion structural protein [Klebsiella phage N1M2]QGH72070.1 putative virion structural protein [Klebsiella phage N1M2]